MAAQFRNLRTSAGAGILLALATATGPAAADIAEDLPVLGDASSSLISPEMERQITARIPQGRLGEPEDMVAAVLFLCSSGSTYINGQTIYVDGGALAYS